MANILVVDDERSMREMLQILLEGEGHEVVAAADVPAAISACQKVTPDLVFSDLKLPSGTGMEVLTYVRENHIDTQVIMMTAYATAENAVEAMRLGAYDYQIKPVKVGEIRVLSQKALEKVRLLRDNRELSAQLRKRYGLSRLVGRSRAMDAVVSLIEKVASTRTNVLVEGESGTGKELVARAIHEDSPRAAGPFIAVNCGAIPETLIEAELFGHVSGAFTGATRARPGLFEASNGGTVLLDEIGDLPQHMQVKLLRVIQERTVRRVGEERERPIDIRIVAATNRDLQECVKDGIFREDLFYRLNVVRIRVPPLRERREDIPLLVRAFLGKYCEETGKAIGKIEPPALEVLQAYSFPGNVRELENYVERAVTLASGDSITLEDLPEEVRSLPARSPIDAITVPDDGLDMPQMLEALERNLIGQALERSEGVKTRAGELLGLSFRSIRYRCKKLGIAAGDDDE